MILSQTGRRFFFFFDPPFFFCWFVYCPKQRNENVWQGTTFLRASVVRQPDVGLWLRSATRRGCRVLLLVSHVGICTKERMMNSCCARNSSASQRRFTQTVILKITFTFCQSYSFKAWIWLLKVRKSDLANILTADFIKLFIKQRCDQSFRVCSNVLSTRSRMFYENPF